MTYEQAKRLIDDNKKALDIYITHSDPPHRVLGSLIAPADSRLETESFIFEQLKLNRDNKEILEKLNVMNCELKAFVVLLYKGNNLIQPLESYISVPNFFSAMKNEE